MTHPLIAEIAPEETYVIHDRKITVRRDDLAFRAPLPPNAKMSALFELVKHAYVKGYKRVVMFAKKQQGTSYAIGLPVFCKMFGITPLIVAPKAERQPIPDWIFQMHKDGLNAELKFVHPNMVSINVNQSKKIAEELGAYFIPFGFDSAISVEAHAKKFALPQHVGTLVLATMTGMILAGTLRQIYERQYNVERVYAVSCGRPAANVEKSMRKHLNWNKEVGRHLTIFEYPRNFTSVLSEDKMPFPLHPDYELKAWDWLVSVIERKSLELPEPIYFVNVGR